MTEGGPSGFGARLRRLREAARMTQEELAERAGMTAQGVGALERGERRRPYRHTVRALATALNLADSERDALLEMSRRRSDDAESAPLAPEVGLPTPPSTLIGRERDVSAIKALLVESDTRLLTLTGPGGVGKTHLALEVAAAVATSFPGGVAFVDLARLADSALVLPAIASALGMRESGGLSLRDLLYGALRDRRLLLVLDNVEHLLAAAPDIADLLVACPYLVVLATSRAALRVRWEHEYPVAPLALPALNRTLTAAEVAFAPAAQLFIERARAHVPDFGLTDADAAAVAAICRRLDGLPLALELAAARARLLRPRELQSRLDRALPLLTGGARDLPARQRTLRDTVAWSYDLLTERERVLFRRLAPFAGGCTLAATEAVCNSDGDLGPDLLDGFSALIDASLLRRDEGMEGESRFGMLETIREYASEQLAASGEDAILRRRHAEYFLTLAEAGQPTLRSVEDLAWLARMEAEHDNLRAALIWGRAEGTSPSETPAGYRDIGLALALAAWWFWVYRGHWSEGRSWLTEGLRRIEAGNWLDARTWAIAHFDLGFLDFMQGDHPAATRRLEESARLAEELGDRYGMALTLLYRGLLAFRSGHYPDARAQLSESVTIFRALGEGWELAMAIFGLGEATWPHDRSAASALYAESERLFRAVGAIWALAFPLSSLGRQAMSRGEYRKRAPCSRRGWRSVGR